ncbi:hypothetical protein NIES25_57050 (plasmid) [Nostoc linckia NIES-25]|nr:hypothetical protein NIES25_57050 [Nostoc linckia NIES-25]
MSQSGLAKFVDTTPAAISRLISKVRLSDPKVNKLPSCLKRFAGMSLTLTEYSDRQGQAIIEDGFCAGVVEYYANWSKPRGNIKAQQALTLIQHLGMRVFIHQKTGWKSNSSSPIPNDFEQEFAAHKERFTVKQILKIEDRPELMSAVQMWQQKHSASRRIFADTNDALNQCLQGLKSREIKKQNNLSQNSAIRDYYDTRPLMDYSAMSKLAANQIRYHDVHPIEAV